MSTLVSYDTRRQSPPLSEYQEMELAAEALEIFGEEELEEFLGNVLRGVAAGAGRVIRPAVAGPLGGVLKGVATAMLPAAGPLGQPMARRPGEDAGGRLGRMIDGLLELELEWMAREDAELERARRYVGLAATSAHHAALAPRDEPPRGVVTSALAHAIANHAPDLLEHALGGATEYEERKPRRGGDKSRGRHTTLKRGKSGEGRHQAADKRWASEQQAAAERAEAARRAARAKEEAARAAAKARLEKERILKGQLATLKNQKRHAELHGQFDKAAELQAQIHDVSTALARVARGEQELAGMPV